MDSDPPLPDDAHAAPKANAEMDADRLDALLFGEELLPVPLDLFARVRDAVRLEPPTPRETLADARDRSPVRRRMSVARGIAAAVLVSVGAALTYAGVEPVAAAAETLRVAGVPSELGLSGRPPVADAALLPWGADWSGTRGPSRDLAALARVPDAMPGGPLTLASLALVLVGSGLGLAWRGSRRRLPVAGRPWGAS